MLGVDAHAMRNDTLRCKSHCMHAPPLQTHVQRGNHFSAPPVKGGASGGDSGVADGRSLQSPRGLMVHDKSELALLETANPSASFAICLILHVTASPHRTYETANAQCFSTPRSPLRSRRDRQSRRPQTRRRPHQRRVQACPPTQATQKRQPAAAS